MSTIYGIIPARLESSRLPEKLLLEQTGQPLLQHTWEAACRSRVLDQVIIATDNDRIARAARDFGGYVQMTGPHPSGTDRVAEVADRLPPGDAIIVNLQGDEPEIDPRSVDQLVATIGAYPDADLATLVTPLTSEQPFHDPSCVKVVCSGDGRALYFSRAPIPHDRDGTSPAGPADAIAPRLLHIGIYAYRRDALRRLAALPPSPLEQLERLEQLRALEAGMTIRVRRVRSHAAGIDTLADYQAFVRRWSASRAA